MAILNYTTKVEPAQTAGEIIGLLAKRGAQQVSMSYAEGELAGLRFVLQTAYGYREFELPVRFEGILAALRKDRKLTASQKTPEQARRVAWRVAKVWLEAQCAFIDAGLATMDETLLPYMIVNPAGQTAYQVMAAKGAIEAGV